MTDAPDRRPHDFRIVLRVLAAMRGALALFCIVVGVKWAGPAFLLLAGWYGVPAALVMTGARWVLWMLVGMNALTVGLGLLVLPDFGHLHGGEAFAFAAMPAAFELMLAAAALRLRAGLADKAPGRLD